eukprot:2603289-Rhodomonas_salina.2
MPPAAVCAKSGHAMQWAAPSGRLARPGNAGGTRRTDALDALSFWSTRLALLRQEALVGDVVPTRATSEREAAIHYAPDRPVQSRHECTVSKASHCCGAQPAGVRVWVDDVLRFWARSAFLHVVAEIATRRAICGIDETVALRTTDKKECTILNDPRARTRLDVTATIAGHPRGACEAR